MNQLQQDVADAAIAVQHQARFEPLVERDRKARGPRRPHRTGPLEAAHELMWLRVRVLMFRLVSVFVFVGRAIGMGMFMRVRAVFVLMIRVAVRVPVLVDDSVRVFVGMPMLL
ncbi:hypothetical protein WPS_17650 [Vulcanimicrobium alpinum]|uniref:Uncharacterized protein n=2 Tax=Vulcanimicrobium alpinum TaxID=3016050 RepID=A0AAN1XWX6_UNVUL|nr:hypothetical protein WPS_17650 [Vulcanimicrobium alpinum]